MLFRGAHNFPYAARCRSPLCPGGAALLPAGGDAYPAFHDDDDADAAFAGTADGMRTQRSISVPPPAKAPERMGKCPSVP